MNVTGTKQAFKMMISERGIYKKLGVSRSTVAGWKAYLIKNEHISIDKMEEILLKYGATVVSDKVWNIPTVKA